MNKNKTTPPRQQENRYLPKMFFSIGMVMLMLLVPAALAIFTNFWSFIPKSSAFYSFRFIDWMGTLKTIGSSIIFFLIPDLLVSYSLGLLSSFKLITKSAASEYGNLATNIFIALWLTFVLTIIFNNDQFSIVASFLSIVALLSFLYKKK